MAPQFVKPYVKSNKNDMRDAEAIAEAVTRPTMRFVPIKDIDQQDIQALQGIAEASRAESDGSSGSEQECTDCMGITESGWRLRCNHELKLRAGTRG
jgi:hypothetical protein